MCGISGICYFGSSGEASPEDETRTVLARLNQAQVHRGPDDEGYLFVNTVTGGFQVTPPSSEATTTARALG